MQAKSSDRLPCRVLFINHVSQVSGAEESLLGLIRGLPAHGFTPEVALPLGGPLEKRLAEMGVRVHPVALGRLKRRASPFRQLTMCVRLGVCAGWLSRLVRRRGIALVHANSAVAAIPGLLAARRARVPSFWHVRDLVPLGRLGAWLGRSATRVIAISEAVATEAARWGVPRERLVTIPNGVDPERFRPNAELGRRLREELGIPCEAFVVAMAAQIVPWKGHHLLLDALGRLRRSDPEADLRALIAGADLFADHADYEALLRVRAQQPDLAGAVTFLGHRTDIEALYNACDVFVLPSRREPFGRALVEAMACGKPAIATAEAGPAEIITNGETGLLVPPNDAGALAEALSRLRREDTLRAALAQRGRAHVHAHYTEARMVAQLAETYREVLAEHARRH